MLVPPPERRDSARQGNRAPCASDSAGKQRIYIIETPKDSPRPSLGLAVSYALSRLWYYCGHFCERYEWKVFLDGKPAKKGDSWYCCKVLTCESLFAIIEKTETANENGILYAQKLREAGVEVTLKETKGTMHGFDIMQKAEITRLALSERIKFMKKVLERDP